MKGSGKNIDAGKDSGSQKDSRKIPVRIGDANNTVIYIKEGQDPELAKAYFLSRLDPYNPARSEIRKPDIEEQDDELIKEEPTEQDIKKVSSKYLKQKEAFQERQQYAPFKF